MYFNVFAPGASHKDMSETDEFRNLLGGAKALGIPHKLPVRYTSRNILANGLRFHLLEWGEPSSPDLLLLHGGHLSAHTWDFVSLALADRYHVIAVDWRGHGDTEWPRDWDMSFGSLIDDLAAIFEELRLDMPLVMAH
jgi:alpha-beta hydrolase superfamily lysophospholipase